MRYYGVFAILLGTLLFGAAMRLVYKSGDEFDHEAWYEAKPILTALIFWATGALFIIHGLFYALAGAWAPYLDVF